LTLVSRLRHAAGVYAELGPTSGFRTELFESTLLFFLSPNGGIGFTFNNSQECLTAEFQTYTEMHIIHPA
jgi:hypothetical protein